MKMPRLLALLLVLLMLTVSAAAEETAEKDYTHLTVGNTTPFEGNFFTPMWGNITSDLDVRLLIHGYNLIEWNSEAGTFMIDPSVVSGMVVTENAAGDHTYTLAIYSDLYYSDGTRVTARDYAFSILLSLAPQIRELGGKNRPLEYLLGYQDYVSGRTPYLSGVRVLSDLQFSVTINHEYLPFFYELGWLDCTPCPASVIAPGCTVRDDGNGVYLTPGLSAEALRTTLLDAGSGYLSHPSVTSGPYRLISYDGKKAEMEINPRYKGNSKGIRPSIETITVETVTSEEMPELLEEGKVSLLNKCVSPEAVQKMTELASHGAIVSSTYPRTGCAFLAFCCERDAVASLPVRQAIAYCLDKPGYVADTAGNYGLRVDGYYGLGQWMVQIVNGTLAYPVAEPADGADAAAQAAYADEMAAWQRLTLSDVPVYDLNLEEAKRYLENDGWTLNRDGQTYDAARDDVRCKQIGGKLVALDLTLLCPEENGQAGALKAHLADNLAKAGICLTVETAPMEQVLSRYYNREARGCDLIYMASNFDGVFDPSAAFEPGGAHNATRIEDRPLYEAALNMRRTAPDDLLGYVTGWISFQKRFQQTVPMIPLYSGVYFDFYPRELQNYDVSAGLSWSQAIVSATYAPVPEEAADGETAAGESFTEN